MYYIINLQRCKYREFLYLFYIFNVILNGTIFTLETILIITINLMSLTNNNLALISRWNILRRTRIYRKNIYFHRIFIFSFSSISVQENQFLPLHRNHYSPLPLMRGMVTRNPYAFIPRLKSRKRTDFRNDRSPIISIPRALRESSPHYRTYLA